MKQLALGLEREGFEDQLSVGDSSYHAVPYRMPEPEGNRLRLEPYLGCEFECPECTASALYEGALGEVEVRRDLPRLLARHDLSSLDITVGELADPWQPAEKHFGLTRSILQALLLKPFASLSLRTRSLLVGRDADLLVRLSRAGKVNVTFPVATLDRNTLKLIEPGAPPAGLRFKAMKSLASRGLTVGLALSPLVPGVNDKLEKISPVLRRARDSGATFALAEPMKTKITPESWQLFKEHLGEHKPWLNLIYLDAFPETDRQRRRLKNARRLFEEQARRLGFSIRGSI